MTEQQVRYVVHPGWVAPNRYVGQAELRRLHRVPADAEVIVLDGTRRRRFYGLPNDIHLWPREEDPCGR